LSLAVFIIFALVFALIGSLCTSFSFLIMNNKLNKQKQDIQEPTKKIQTTRKFKSNKSFENPMKPYKDTEAFDNKAKNTDNLYEPVSQKGRTVKIEE
jgi:uncharacterized membrane protein YgaE (UPF0421/DUF939 family)